MRKETDLARVKMIAHVLLDMPIAETSFSPAIVSHPFTSTGVTATQNEDGNITVVDLLNNKEDYDRAPCDFNGLHLLYLQFLCCTMRKTS